MRIIWCLVFLIFSSPSLWAAGKSQAQQVKEANALFHQEQWDGAIDGYLNALEGKKNTDIVQYDLGSAFYKKGNYDQAIEHLQKTLSDKSVKSNKNLSVKSYYNLGNALYKKGRSLENNKLDEAIESLQKAIEYYDRSASLNPKDEDAKYNKNFVDKELERLKKKKEEQSKQQQQQNQQNSQSSQGGNQSQEQNQSNSSNGQDKKGQDQTQEEKAKEQQQKENQAKQNQSEQNQEHQNPAQSGQQKEGSKEALEQEQQGLEKKQAKELLEEYERQDAPRGILNFVDRHQGERHVDKDW